MATEKGVWDIQDVRDKQVSGEWSYDGLKQLWVWGQNERGQLGQNQPHTSHKSSPVQIPGTWSEIEIGRNRNRDKPGNYYLDEVRVWDAAISQANIQAWMHKTLSSSHPNYSDLQVYFQMNSNSISGTTLLDASTNGNNATMYNSSGINTSSSCLLYTSDAADE